MPQRAWSNKRERQYDHIKEGLVARGESNDVADPFNSDNEITSGLKQVLFINTGSLRKADNARLKVESLVVTGKMTATIPAILYSGTLNTLDGERAALPVQRSLEFKPHCLTEDLTLSALLPHE